MTTKNCKIYDAETGETQTVPNDTVLVAMPNRIKMHGWFMMFQKDLMNLAKDRTTTYTLLRVLLALGAYMDYENKLVFTHRALARELGLQPPHLSDALKELQNRGLIEPREKIGVTQTYAFASDLAWKGRASTLKKQRDKKMAHQLKEQVRTMRKQA